MIRRGPRIRKRQFAVLAALFFIAAAYAYRGQINDKLSCWAYYDQCTAERISGLSSAACLARPDAVSYLTTEGVCLVRQE